MKKSSQDEQVTPLTRREVLAGGGALTLATLVPALTSAAPVATPGPLSNEEVFGWVEDLYGLGRRDRYGYRMPGTKSDHEAAHYLADKLRQFGLSDVRLEPVPIAVAFPDRWSLRLRAGGHAEELPCSFVRYCRYTPEEGVSAEMVYVGKGAPADFDRVDVRGKIVVVDMLVGGIMPTEGPTYFTYDPDDTIKLEDGKAKWPPINHDSSFQAAVARGAVGWIGIVEIIGDDTNQYLHWFVRYELPALTISSRDGRRLRELLSKERAEVTITVTGTRGQGTSYNVYGFIPGKRSEEYIVVKTHHDGWATNEASGSAVTLGVARNFATSGEKPERTLMFFFRASHFGVGWSMGRTPSDPPVEETTALFGLKPGWEKFQSLAARLMPRTVAANNIEMVGRQYHLSGDVWHPTALPAVRYWGVTGPQGGANPILLNAVRTAIGSHRLRRSIVSNFFIGDGMDYPRNGIPFVNFISHNIFQFSNKDTPETVMKEDLAAAVAAFVDIVRAEDAAAAAQLQPAGMVPIKFY
ncbi:MAG TPA: M28 family peptidase [Steroidobacteraceae bacterium]|nr:M28 family peptidase [Steroidobacteraceae bacterium]